MQRKIADIMKRRGVAYPSFEIYGGVSGFYDYGPIGSRIKKNIEQLIREYYIIDEECYEVECPTLSPEPIWVASGHVESFTDYMTECLKCGEPYRADHLVEENTDEKTDGLSIGQLERIIAEKGIKCPKCEGRLDRVYNYNLMFQTYVGPGKNKETVYLRPETAQTTYLPFRRLWEVARKRLPFGVLQIGRSFRNEISPRQGMLRLREFNQAEMQYFVEPDNKGSERFSRVAKIKAKAITKKEEEVELTLSELVGEKIIEHEIIAYFLGRSIQLFAEMGMDPGKLRMRQHKDDERAFYSTDTWDIEYLSPIYGRVEIVGISDRTDYDLRSHMELSKQDMTVSYEGKKFIPHVIEVAYGIDRPFYCAIESSYREEEDRTYLALPEKVAPYLVGIFPLVKKDSIPEKAQEIFEDLKEKRVFGFYDAAGSIGKRYARADEIGVPFCVTVDYDTLEDESVTVRVRDSREQTRVKIADLYSFISRR